MMAQEHPENYRPSLYDIYREIGEIKTKVENIASNQEADLKTAQDNEARISKLETRWGLMTGLGVAASMVVSFIFTALTSWFKIRITQ